MPKAIEQLGSSLTVGHFALGLRDAVARSVKQQVHDGDTINVRAVGNFGVRFLGVDTPEISFTLPGGRSFVPTSDARWEQFLIDPFDAQYSDFDRPLREGLQTHLSARLGPGTGANHHRHASAAERALEREVSNDLAELGQSPDDFRFFLAFASEILDRYGRLLAYVNREQEAEPRPLDYNGRMLRAGLALPYFIWPNVNPFRRQRSLRDSVPDPGTARAVADQESTLRNARQWVSDARQQGLGCFAPGDPLRLEAFELRFLAQRRAPSRWVIDLSRDDNVLTHPQRYYEVRNVEDRLYIPDEHVALFTGKGWTAQA